MHQSVVEHAVASAAMTAVPYVNAAPGAMRRRMLDALRDAAGSAPPPQGRSPLGGPVLSSSYLTAAGVAAGLVAAWAGLCVL